MGRDHHGQELYGWDNEFGSEIKVYIFHNLLSIYALINPHLGFEAIHCKPNACEQCGIP